ncbi:glycosyltransferase family 4 protein [Bacillaceae bacterium CLA-AA-H227]|uniref:Glycosyltransferase family 4 protein n=1 Tax=Robertmurraya yapensis (ex Hitch et al 2024) TaxID=3133160 RepID=A0ACC6SBR7_9BACI
MRVLHLNAGAETGGGMHHILQLLKDFNKAEVVLGVFEKGVMYDRAVNNGINVVIFQQSSRLDFSVTKKIISYIDQNNIDIIHTHGPRANFYGFYIKKKRPDCKWITTVHSNPHLDFMGRGLIGKIFTRIHLWVLRKPDHFLAISNKFKQLLIDEKIVPEKITTIFNGIDFSEDKNNPTIKREDFEVDPNDFLMIMVARLDPIKGHIEVFKAFRELIKEHKDTKLLLVGDGALEEDLIMQSRNMGLSDNIRFLGYSNDVSSLIRLSDLAILASYSESFPLVLLEAAREKVPVISTDVGGVKDLVPSNSYGWVIPVRDHIKLRRTMEEAIELKKKGNLKKLGENLYERASTLFTIEHFKESVYVAYEEASKKREVKNGHSLG